MNELKQISGSSVNVLSPQGNMEQIIDLFVEMCFDDVHDAKRISQFKLTGMQLGFSLKDLYMVVEMGKAEYKTLLDEINKAFLTNELN